MQSIQKGVCSGIFIAGTDTDVGKTYIGCHVASALRKANVNIGAYKPVSSGIDRIEESDGYQLWSAIGKREALELVAPQRFSAPLAPPVAAAQEGKCVDIKAMLDGFAFWKNRCEFLLVEGAGGLMSPVSHEWTNADLILQFELPVILVAPWRLGVVNQVLTTLIAARTLGITVTCIVLNSLGNSEPNRSHAELLQSFLDKENSERSPILRCFSNSDEPLIDAENWRTQLGLN